MTRSSSRRLVRHLRHLRVTVFAMWSKAGHRVSAYAALIAGTAVYAGGEHLEMLPHPYLASVAAALVVYVAAAPLRPSDTAVSG